MYNAIKKVFSFSVVAATILWSVGVAALVPSVVQGASVCPTLAANDMIKVKGYPAIYSLGNDLQVYYFYSGDEFKSWQPNYGNYISISQACFDTLEVPKSGMRGINYRPGSFLIKRGASDQLYVVLPGNTKAKISQEIANVLYGKNAYADGVGATVKTVADPAWGDYRNDASDITEAKVHPGMIFKVEGQAETWFVDKDNKLREVTKTGFTANKFEERFVRLVPASAIEGLETGNAIDAEDWNVVDKSQGAKLSDGASNSEEPEAKGSLNVALSSATPAATDVPKNGTRVPFTKVVLSAGADEAITISSIVVTRTGLSEYDAFDRVWMEKDGIRVSSQSKMNNSDEANLTFSPALTISAGSSVTLEIVASLKSGENHSAALGIASTKAITATSASIGGSYPINGNLMRLVNYEVATAAVEIDDKSYPNVKVGDTEVEIANFNVEQTATTSKDIIFKSIILRNDGTETLSKVLTGVYLEKAGKKLPTIIKMDSRYLTLTLENGGELIERGDNADFIVKADIIAKEQTGDGSLDLKINKKEDVSIVEKSTGFGAAVTIIDDEEQAAKVTIDAGKVTIIKKSTQPGPTTAVKGEKDVVSLLVNISADEDITADGLRLGWEGTEVTSSFQNARVLLNGKLVGSFDPEKDSEDAGNFEVEGTVNLKAGNNELKVTVDVKTGNSVTTTSKIKFLINDEKVFNGQNATYITSDRKLKLTGDKDVNGSPKGAEISIEAATLEVVRKDGFSTNRTVVFGSENITLGKFEAKANNDAVTITSIVLGENISVTSSGATKKVADNSIYNVRIVVDGTQVNGIKRFNNGATFSNLNIEIDADKSKVIEVLADFDTNSTGTFKSLLTFNANDGRGKAIKPAETSDTAQTLILEEGDLFIKLSSENPDAGYILAKENTKHEIANFELSALYDEFDVKELSFSVVSSTDGSTVLENDDSIDSRISKISVLKNGVEVGSGSVMNGLVTIKNISGLKVEAGKRQAFSVAVELTPIREFGESAKSFKLLLTDLKANSNTGEEMIKDSTDLGGGILSNKKEIRSSIPVFAKITLDKTGDQAGDEEVLKFTIKADGDQNIKITKLVFAKSGDAKGDVKDFDLFEGTTLRKGVTGVSGDTVTFSDIDNIEITAGVTKTFTVKAATDNISSPKDKTFGLSLKDAPTTNIVWAEAFVGDDNVAGDAEHLYVLPISHSKKY